MGRKAKLRQQRKQSATEALDKKLKQQSVPVENAVMAAPGEVKMSDVLIDFIAPYGQHMDTEEGCQIFFKLAIMAWNLSFFPEQELQDMLEDLLSQFPEELEDQRMKVKKMLCEMMFRKQLHFSEYNQQILDYEIVDKGKGGFHVSVTSTQELDNSNFSLAPDGY